MIIAGALSLKYDLCFCGQDSSRTVIAFKQQHIPDHLYELPEDIRQPLWIRRFTGKQIWPTLVRRWWTLFVRKSSYLILSRIRLRLWTIQKKCFVMKKLPSFTLMLLAMEAQRLNWNKEEICENHSTTYYNEVVDRCSRYRGWETPRNAFARTNPRRSGFPRMLLVIIGALTIGAAEEFKLLLWTVGVRTCRWNLINADRYRNFYNRRSLKGITLS